MEKLNLDDYTVQDAFKWIVVAELKVEDTTKRMKELKTEYNLLEKELQDYSDNINALLNHNIVKIEREKLERSIVTISDTAGNNKTDFLLEIEFGEGHHNLNGSKNNTTTITKIDNIPHIK